MLATRRAFVGALTAAPLGLISQSPAPQAVRAAAAWAAAVRTGIRSENRRGGASRAAREVERVRPARRRHVRRWREPRGVFGRGHRRPAVRHRPDARGGPRAAHRSRRQHLRAPRRSRTGAAADPLRLAHRLGAERRQLRRRPRLARGARRHRSAATRRASARVIRSRSSSGPPRKASRSDAASPAAGSSPATSRPAISIRSGTA